MTAPETNTPDPLAQLEAAVSTVREFSSAQADAIATAEHRVGVAESTAIQLGTQVDTLQETVTELTEDKTLLATERDALAAKVAALEAELATRPPDPVPVPDGPPPEALDPRPWGRVFYDHRGMVVDQYPGFDPTLSTASQPRTYLDTTYPVRAGGQSFRATDAASFLAAYKQADAAGGGTIRLAPAFAAHTVTLDARTTDGWIVVEPETPPAGFPVPGVRVTPAVGAQLPAFTASGTGGSAAALTLAEGAHHVRFVGVRFRPADNGGYLTALTDLALDVHDVTFDRCYWTSFDAYTKCRRAVGSRGYRLAVIDSWIEDMKEVGTDAQGVAVFYGRGQVKIVNCYLSATAEPFMAGGVNPPQGDQPTYYPADLEFRRNHCRKPQAWNTQHPAARDAGDTLGGPYTVTAWDPATATATLSDAPDAAWVGSGSWVHVYARVTAGPGAGSWWEVSGYPAADRIAFKRNGTTGAPAGRMTNTRIGGMPGVGSVLELCRYHRWMAKNLFELKNMRFALVSENVFENSWDGDDSQPHAVLLKSVNQSGRLTDVWHETADVTLWDNVVVNCLGGIALSQSPSPPAKPAQRFHLDNWLLLAGPMATIGTNTLKRHPAYVQTDHVAISRLTAVGFSHSWMNFSAASANETPKLDGVTVTRCLAPCGTYGVRFDQGAANTVDAASARFEGNGIVGTGASAYVPPKGFTRGPTFGFVHERPDDLWGAADYSLSADSPFAAMAGGPPGCDWPELQRRTRGVRAAVPYEWGVDP